MSDVFSTAAVDLAAMVKAREISPVELMRLHIQRIERVNPALNAVVVERFDAARAEAKSAEERLMKEKPESLPAFHGVPCTIKEFMGIEGMPNTGGVVAHENRKATRDATVVARVRAAGAIPMGLTNVPEGGLWMETECKVYGRTNNPWNVKRTPGGSSGGEGAIIAAGASPFGLGADVGGSIRIPAAFCGIFGHKPSGRLVPTTGHFPAADDPIAHALCLGPMTRSARDLMPLLRIIAGPDGECAAAREMPLGDPESVRLDGMKVVILDNGGRPRIRRSMQEAIQRAAAALEARGARVETLEIPELRLGVEIWGGMLSDGADPDAYKTTLSPDRPLQLHKEFVRVMLGRSRHTAAALMMAVGDVAAKKMPGRAKKMAALGLALRNRIEEAVGDNGVFLYPPYTRAAPRHYLPMVTALDGACTCVFNGMEFPITVAPVGFDPDGMPLAVQIGAKRGQDHVSIAAALAIEADLGGWRPAMP